jgi:hypothetical protein
MQFLRIGRGGKVFEQIGETEPELLNKLVVINGDVTLPKLGMLAEDTQRKKQNNLLQKIK